MIENKIEQHKSLTMSECRRSGTSAGEYTLQKFWSSGFELSATAEVPLLAVSMVIHAVATPLQRIRNSQVHVGPGPTCSGGSAGATRFCGSGVAPLLRQNARVVSHAHARARRTKPAHLVPL